MHFRDIAELGRFVRFTCFVWSAGKFRQWVPRKLGQGVKKLDQTGEQLINMDAKVLDMRVHNIMPTAYNFMNVYLY